MDIDPTTVVHCRMEVFFGKIRLFSAGYIGSVSQMETAEVKKKPCNKQLITGINEILRADIAYLKSPLSQT